MSKSKEFCAPKPSGNVYFEREERGRVVVVKDFPELKKRCRLWQRVGDGTLGCVGLFYPHCGGYNRWMPCCHRYPIAGFRRKR